ncbi:cache domain-containing protein [Methanoculleus sp.]|uniref:cache domain-containing protein n=1 Tax=Methanoculleus sp. TaxID=90427 RepID=UPI002FC65F56
MRILFIIVALVVAVAVCGAGCTGENQPPPEERAESVLQEAVTGINSELVSVRASAGESARVLGEAGLTSAAGREAVRQAMLDHPHTESTLVVTKDGIVAMAVPENYAGLVNTSLLSQPQTERVLRGQAPLTSEVFHLEEGFSGITQSYPVFGPDYLGYVSIAYRPDTLIERVVAPLTNSTPYDVWVMQTDGVVIYDTTPEEIGKNLFSDPAYQSPELQEAFSRIAAEPSGSLVYSFWDTDWARNVTKEANWDTAGIDGAEWRVVVTRSTDA